MLAISRRTDTSELEAARRIVSRAELEALEKAERMCAEADAMLQAITARWDGGESTEGAEAEGARIIGGARQRAKDLLTNALDMIEVNTAAVEAGRRQNEAMRLEAEETRAQADEYLACAARTLEEAQRHHDEVRAQAAQTIASVQSECQRLVAAARAAAEVEVELADRRIADKLNALCDSMGMAHGTLDDLLGASADHDEDDLVLDFRTPVGIA